MMNNNLYTAVGKFHIKGSVGGMRCPLVTLGGREFILDMQEMTLWTILNLADSDGGGNLPAV